MRAKIARMKRTIAAAAAGYLLGSIPSADVAARLASGGQLDLRASGSGNPGGANAADVLGKKWGYPVMAADIGKGVLASFVGRAVGGPNGAHVAGTASVVGHCFPVWSGFRGGKGFASAVGQNLATFPAFFPVEAGIVAVTAALPWKSRSVAVVRAGGSAWVGAGLYWWLARRPNGWGPKPTVALPLAAAATTAVVWQRFAKANANKPA